MKMIKDKHRIAIFVLGIILYFSGLSLISHYNSTFLVSLIDSKRCLRL